MNVLTGCGGPTATRCRMNLAMAGALLGAVAFAAPAGAAETRTEVEKLVPESSFCNPSHWYEYCFNSELGISVALDDETLMAAMTIGHRNADDVYIFDVIAYGREAGGRWAPVQALGRYGGWEVGGPDLVQIDVDATHALVGNPLWSDLPHGYVYAFGRDDAGYWSRTDTLRHPEIDYWGSYFGFDVDLRGNTAVIDGRVFEADDGNWAFAQTLDPSLPESWSEPHDWADFDGQTIVTAGPDYGVQLWERDTAGAWVVQQAIPDPGRPGEAGFGEAVAVDGDVLLIGAPGTDGPGEAAGAVLVYLRGSDGRWAQAATLQASDAGPDGRFGDRLVIDGTTALVRAPGADGAVPDGGAVYWFERRPDGRWLERGKLVPSDGYAGDRFAHDFDLAGDTVVIGAPGRPPQEWPDSGRADAGAVYLYSLAGSPGPGQIAIDVRPGASINLAHPSFGLIPVAILTTSRAAGEIADFDALQLDPSTARLGPDHAAVAISPRNVRVRDVDRDGDLDLLLRFRARETGIECGATTIRLGARTYAGNEVSGEDTIRTVACNGGAAGGLATPPRRGPQPPM